MKIRRFLNLLSLLLLAGLLVPGKLAQAQASCIYSTSYEMIATRMRFKFPGGASDAWLSGDFYGYTYGVLGTGNITVYIDASQQYATHSVSGSVTNTINVHTTRILFLSEDNSTGLTSAYLCPEGVGTATPSPTPSITSPATATTIPRPVYTLEINGLKGTGWEGPFSYTRTGLSSGRISATLNENWNGFYFVYSFSGLSAGPHTFIFEFSSPSVPINFDYSSAYGCPEVVVTYGGGGESVTCNAETLTVTITASNGPSGNLLEIRFGIRTANGHEGLPVAIDSSLLKVDGYDAPSDHLRRNLLEDWSFELIWGENEYWYHGQPYTNYPGWWCDAVPNGDCYVPKQAKETVWERYNYNACPWRAEDTAGPLDCLIPIYNFSAALFNGAPKCGDAYQATDWGSPSINQDFIWPGGDLYWKISYRGDYHLFGGPTYGTYGTAYAYISSQNDAAPIYVLLNERAADANWKTAKNKIPNVPAGEYRLWLASPDGYIVEWDDTAISEAPLTDECDIQVEPTATPEYLTTTPQGYPSEQPTGTPHAWTSTVTPTPGPTLTPSKTGQATRTPGATRTIAPSLTPNMMTETAGLQLTRYWQTLTAFPTATIGPTRTPYGTPQSTYTPVPNTPGAPTNTPVPLPTEGLPPIQEGPVIRITVTGTPTGWEFGPGGEPYPMPPPGLWCLTHPLECDWLYCMSREGMADPKCWDLDYCGSHPDDPGCSALQVCMDNPDDPSCWGNSVSCEYECLRPGNVNIAHWLDYETCEVKKFFCWGSAQNATAVAIPRKLTEYEPFGSVAEVVEGVVDLRTQVASYDWYKTGAEGVHDAISPSVNKVLKGTGTDPWTGASPGFDFRPQGGVPSGYTAYCSTKLSSLLSQRLAQGSCYALSKLREIGYLPWVQFGLNLAAIGAIIRGFLLVIFRARTFGAAVRTPAPAQKESRKS